MDQALVEVVEDDEAVVEALAPDPPLVDERDRVGFGAVGGGVRLDLGVDDDLGAGPALDGLGDLLRLLLGLGLEGLRVVVDALAGHRRREWRAGGRRGIVAGRGGGDEHEGGDGREQQRNGQSRSHVAGSVASATSGQAPNPGFHTPPLRPATWAVALLAAAASRRLPPAQRPEPGFHVLPVRAVLRAVVERVAVGINRFRET